MNEVYISVDIETDGPIPGDNSMLTLGAVPVVRTGPKAWELRVGDAFYIRMLQRQGALMNHDTEDWWRKQDDAVRYEAFHAEPRVHPREAMVEFAEWTESVSSAQPVFVARPTGFDYSFVNWYLVHYLGAKRAHALYSHRALDMRSLMMGMHPKLGFYSAQSSLMDEKYHLDTGHKITAHRALSDAVEQGSTFMGMMSELDSRNGSEQAPSNV